MQWFADPTIANHCMNLLRTIPLVLVLVLVLGVGAAAASTGTQPPVTWDLSREYPSDTAWTASFADVQARSTRFSMRRGTPISSARQLADLLDEADFLRGKSGNLAQFAVLTSAFNRADVAAQARRDAATGLEAQVETDVSWVDSAISMLGREKLLAWSKSEPRLGHHGWALNAAITTAGHNYPAGSEAAYAALERAAFMSSDVYNLLMASNLGWASSVDEHGKTVMLDPGAFSTLAVSRQASVRRKAAQTFYEQLRTLEQPLAQLLTRKYGIDRSIAHGREFETGTDAFFARSDGLPPGTFRRMVTVTRANRDTIGRYAQIIGRLNSLTDVQYTDLDMAPPEIGRSFSLEQSEAIAIECLAPLGERYQSIARRRMAEPWFDFATRPNKDPGALGLYWQVGHATHPWGMLSYTDDYAGSRAVAAMATLTMFFVDLPPDRVPPRREEDFPIYGNSIWFLGNLLHLDYLLTHAASRQERIGLLAADLRRVFDTYIQGVVATDFEARVEELVAAGKPPAGHQVTELYLSLLNDYYGEYVQIPESSGEEWMTLTTAFYGHTLDEWAFAMAGAVAMSEQIQAHDAKSIAAIVSPMSRPDSFTSYDLLRDAGANPTTPAFYEAIFRRMNAEMSLLDRELDDTSSKM
jgi:oligoendopeptidase F